LGENVSFILDFAATLFDRVVGILWFATLFDRVVGILWFAFWCGFVVLILWCVTMLCVWKEIKCSLNFQLCYKVGSQSFQNGKWCYTFWFVVLDLKTIWNFLIWLTN